MAIGTVTSVAAWGKSPLDPTFVDTVSVVGPASYTTGGDTGLLAGLRALSTKYGARTIVAALCTESGGYTAEYLVATDLLKVYGTGSAEKAAGTQVDSATNLSGTTFKFLVISK